MLSVVCFVCLWLVGGFLVYLGVLVDLVVVLLFGFGVIAGFVLLLFVVYLWLGLVLWL